MKSFPFLPLRASVQNCWLSKKKVTFFPLLTMLCNACLCPATSFWPSTLRPCQTCTSSPRCRSYGRWPSSRWWAACPFTSSSTCADVSPRPATPSWPLKYWEEPPASFTVGKRKDVLAFILRSLRLHQRVKHGFIPFYFVLKSKCVRRTIKSGTGCLQRGRVCVRSSVILHVFDAKTYWSFLYMENNCSELQVELFKRTYLLSAVLSEFWT